MEVVVVLLLAAFVAGVVWQVSRSRPTDQGPRYGGAPYDDQKGGDGTVRPPSSGPEAQ